MHPSERDQPDRTDRLDEADWIDERLTQPLRTRGRLKAGLVIGAVLVFVAAAVAKPWGAAQPKPPIPSPMQVADATGSVRPELRSDGSACAHRHIEFFPGGDDPLQVPLPQLPIARAGRVAYVQPAAWNNPKAPAGSHAIVVADTSGARTVATETTADGRGGEWLAVRAWSDDGTQLLVAAGFWSAADAAGNCSDLYLIQADGSRVSLLTANGPGQIAVGGTFLAGARSVALLEVNLLGDHGQVQLEKIERESSVRSNIVDCNLDIDRGLPYDGMLARSPDGTRLVMVCPEGVITVDTVSQVVEQILPQFTPRSLGAVGWSRDGTQVVALEDPWLDGVRRLTVDRADWRGRGERDVPTPRSLWESILGTATISPDGSRVLAQTCEPGGTQGSCAERIFAIDVATGDGPVIYQSAPTSEIRQARWLADGSSVVLDDGSGGSIFRPADGSGQTVTSRLPPDALWWVSKPAR